MHCKSGADRAGLMSALYLILNQNVPVDKAKDQLSFKYLHLKHAGHDIKKFHIKVSIESNYLNKMDRIKRSKIVYNLIDNELKNYIHSIQLDII